MDATAVRAALESGITLSTAQVVEALGEAPKELPPIETDIAPERLVSLA